jgi:hypothetical protein
MFFVEPVTGAVVGKIWDERRLIAAFAKDFFDLLAKGQLKIFVFGSAGAGKSTFGKILEGQEEVAKISGSYKVSSDTEYYGVKDKHFVQVAVPPGQAAYLFSDWAPLYNALQDSQRSVVVNIGCWGYHSAEKDELANIAEFHSGITDANRSDFLSNRRKIELDNLEQLVQPLCGYQHKLHMITLITKQDLWWKEKDKVRKFYEDGSEYSKKLERIRKAKGMASFVHHFRSLSFGQINFKTADGHTLFETAAGYDNSLLNANFENFMTLLRQVAK